MRELYFVCPWFGVFAGGAERAVRTLAIEMQRRGWRVEVLTTCSASLYASWEEDGLPAGLDHCDGLAVRRFRLDRGRLDRYRMAVHLWATGQELSTDAMYDFFTYGISSDALVEYVGKLPAAAAVVANPYFHALTFRSVVENPGRVHLLGSFHDEPQFYWPPVADMLREARSVLFQAEEEKALAVRTHGLALGRRLVESPLVGMGIELDAGTKALLASPDRLRAIRKRLGVAGDYFVVVGRKDAGKGIPKLVEWYRAFSERRAVAVPPLVFVGGGDDSLIPPSRGFRDLGFVEEEEKFALMQGALATINLSPNEAFSFVLMESWLCGTPVVVSTACRVTTGHCERSSGGIAVADEAEFRAALETLQDRDLGAAAGRAGRRYVAAEYNWDRVTDAFARSLEEACES